MTSLTILRELIRIDTQNAHSRGQRRQVTASPGCKVLGFAPLSRSQPFKEVIALIHGVNERICIDSLTFCGEVIEDICRGYVEGVSPDAR